MDNAAIDFLYVKGLGDPSSGTGSVISAAIAKRRLAEGVPVGKPTEEDNSICPLIGSMLSRANDFPWWSSDTERTRLLKKFESRVLDTKNSALLDFRSFSCIDSVVRIFTPKSLEMIGMYREAKELRNLSSLENQRSASIALPVLGRIMSTINFKDLKEDAPMNLRWSLSGSIQKGSFNLGAYVAGCAFYSNSRAELLTLIEKLINMKNAF